tara:strand:- start:485 stop:733 length:249 start_codon:yes stop_codon:yes gene_type:complete
MAQLKVDKHVPFPTKGKRAFWSKFADVVLSMEVGDSVLTTNKYDAAALRNMIARHLGKKCTQRQEGRQGEGGIRVWVSDENV